LFFSLICICCFNSAFSQLEVGSNGNVAVKYSGNSTIKSNFSINGVGDNESCTSITSGVESQDVGLRLIKTGTVSNNNNYTRGIYCTVTQDATSPRMAYGIYARAYKGSGVDTSNGRSYGVYAYAGNSTSGWNYGVFGSLYGNNNGAGVFGSSSSLDGGMNTYGKYAGYFHGNVKSTDAMYATVYNTTSDYRLKENIESVGSESVDKIMKLNVVKYNLKQLSIDAGDTATVQVDYYTNESKILQRKHYGLLAQELQEIYPDLVYEGEDGYLSVNYMEIIPLLIKTVQELQTQVNNLTSSPKKTVLMEEGTWNMMNTNTTAYLHQNNPNPFTENTAIMCFIPKDIVNAVLYIYDLNGRQIESRNISERGNTNIIIEGNSLDAGIYIYSLIADGVVVDTKRMILTK